uniref:Uncharacterized protein n=1 Tax=Meloidogyne incognita TaxID=6306 RepID=A0A914MRI6_MELIC
MSGRIRQLNKGGNKRGPKTPDTNDTLISPPQLSRAKRLPKIANAVMSDVHAVEKLWMGDGIEPSWNEPRPKHNRLCHHPTQCWVIYFHLCSFCKCGHNTPSALRNQASSLVACLL